MTAVKPERYALMCPGCRKEAFSAPTALDLYEALKIHAFDCRQLFDMMLRLFMERFCSPYILLDAPFIPVEVPRD